MNASILLPRRAGITSLALLLLFGLANVAHGQDVRWHTDYATALKEAGKKGLPIVINVGTVDCYWCKQLDARTFVDTGVKRLLTDRVIPLKLDANETANAYIVQALRVQSYPTLIFASHDGNILSYREGFLDADGFKEQLSKILVSTGTPDWMQRDFDAAQGYLSKGDHAKAISLLKVVIDDGKSRLVQQKARTLLAELEAKASKSMGKARELVDQGKTKEALETLEQLDRTYPGTLAARRGKQLHGELMSKVGEERKQKPAELLSLAQEEYKQRNYLGTLDRCEEIAARYPDSQEASGAEKLANEIKDNPEWSRKAADQLGNRLCVLYLALADSWLKKGEPQQASHYLERVQKMFPGTTHAEVAATKLARLRGAPERK